MNSKLHHVYPEVYCDLNAQMTDAGYSLERRGSIDDLEKLGLSLQQAVGRRFTFYMDDGDDEGHSDDIMFNGVVEFHPRWGHLATADENGFYWRSQIEGCRDA